jgi:twinkle protein
MQIRDLRGEKNMIQVGKYQVVDKFSNGRPQFKTVCPKCPEEGKTNLKDTCLSVNTQTKLVNCHKCGWAAYYGEPTFKKNEVVYKLPETKNLTELSKDHLNFFTQRRISQQTILRNEIKTAKGNYIAFQYKEGDIVVNIKYRTPEKKFMQSPEAKQTMYKYNDILGKKEIILCEGEIDALSWEEAGFLNATSVSQGAPNEKDISVEKKLACVYNCFDIFEQAEIIYLSVDGDINGQRLQRELIKIFTAEKVKIISHFDKKDANDVLLWYGKEKLLEAFKSAKDAKVDGVYECEEFREEILFNFRNGQARGTTTYFSNIDECWTHRKSEVTVWSGYNNEGKSLLLKQLLLLKSYYEGWKHAVFSPEEMPLSDWYTDLIETYIGKSADITQGKYNNFMSEIEMNEGINFMDKHFFAIYPNEDQTLEQVLIRFSYLVRKKNIDTIVIDPYNQIQHDMRNGEREDLYISRFMSKLKKFAVDHNVCVHLVAHQVTPVFNKGENYPEPNLYKIKGGGTFADKADNIVAVWREFRNTDQSNTEVRFISQKIKKQKLVGTPGYSILNYDRRRNRYNHNGESPFDRFVFVEKEKQKINLEPNYQFESKKDDDFLDENGNFVSPF